MHFLCTPNTHHVAEMHYLKAFSLRPNCMNYSINYGHNNVTTYTDNGRYSKIETICAFLMR